jgi:hypothetical protein
MIPFGAALASARKSSWVLACAEAANNSETRPASGDKENFMMLVCRLKML